MGLFEDGPVRYIGLMPVTKEAVQRFVDLLIAVRPITHRSMFGGIGLYVDGVFFAVIDDDRLYFKSDETTAEAYDTLKADVWVIPSKDGPSVMPYREVPSEILGDRDRLGEWIDTAKAVAERKKTKSKSKKKAG